MTDTAKLTMLTSMTGETDSEVLSTYLSMAADIVNSRAFPFGDGTETMPSKYDHVQVRVAAYMLNKRGAEGEKYHIENGISRQYESGDIPLSLLRTIIPYTGRINPPVPDEEEGEDSEDSGT